MRHATRSCCKPQGSSGVFSRCILLQMGIKWCLILALVWVQALYYKRWMWAPIKSRKIIVDVVN